MKISQAILQLTILIHALFATATPAKHAYIPPEVDGYVDAQSIKSPEPDLQVNGTDLVLQERGVDSSDIASRQVSWGTVLISAVLVSAVITAVIIVIVVDIKDDIPVSSKFNASRVGAWLTVWHSVVGSSLSRWSPTCTIIIPHSTMLYATQNTFSRSMEPRATIGIICTTSFRHPLEGR